MRARLIAAAAALPVIVYAQVPADTAEARADSLTGDLIEQSADNSPIVELMAPVPGDISFRSRAGIALQTAAGYLDRATGRAYAGSPLRSYQRLTAGRRGSFAAGVLVEKDAGEKNLADFATGYLYFPDIGGRGKAVLGDFSLEEGEGVAWWRGASFGKGAEVITPVVRHPRGIVPHRSSGENSFLRGIGGEFSAGPVTAGVVWSAKPEAATLDPGGRVTGFPADGLFRTPAEIAKRNDVTERVAGFSIRAGESAGISWYRTAFSRPLYLEEGRRFEGRSYSTLTGHYALRDDDVQLFGEWGISNRTVGGTSGILVRPSAALSVVASIRRFPEEFLALHGLPFGDRGSNEAGAYAGVRIAPGGGFAIAAFADRFGDMSAAPGRLPAGGGEFLAEPSYTRGGFTAAARYRRRETDETVTSGGGLQSTVMGRMCKASARVSAAFRTDDGVEVEGRVERTLVRHEITGRTEKGILFADRVAARPAPALWFDVQLALFKTDSYDAGIAVVERDVPGVVALPILYGEGVRWSVTASWEAGFGVTVSGKYSELIRDDVARIGTGADELPSNRDNRLTLQVDGAW